MYGGKQYIYAIWYVKKGFNEDIYTEIKLNYKLERKNRIHHLEKMIKERLEKEDGEKYVIVIKSCELLKCINA